MAPFQTSIPVLLTALLGLGSCSSSSDAGGQTADLETIEFSLGHIVERRIHASMWYETVREAYLNSWRPLNETPPPSDPCVEIVSVEGDLENGFEWKVRLTRCEDLVGVTRVVSGEILFKGNKFENEEYTGTYVGIFNIQWSADPDGGRAMEAEQLNREAAVVNTNGNWTISTSLTGMVAGTLQYQSGVVFHEDKIE